MFFILLLALLQCYSGVTHFNKIINHNKMLTKQRNKATWNLKTLSSSGTYSRASCSSTLLFLINVELNQVAALKSSKYCVLIVSFTSEG